MNIEEAKKFVNRPLQVSWTGPKSEELSETVYIFNVGFVPLFGPCLITDKGEIRLDRITSHQPVPEPVRSSD